MAIEMFPGKIIKYGNSIGITIPANVVRYSGIVEGDTVKFYFRKVKDRCKTS